MIPFDKIVIVGGGTAGWMAAASLAKFAPQGTQITLVESPAIGTIGVGEATLPGIRDFNNRLGIDELVFIKRTRATFKLAIEFQDWIQKGGRFFHPFSGYGIPISGVKFSQAWNYLSKAFPSERLEDYCLAIQLCKDHRFAQPHPAPKSPLADYKYAFHFDASLYVELLKEYATERGVELVHGKVEDAILCPTSGNIRHIALEENKKISGNFFIDCTGFKSLLLGDALGVPFIDYSRWLPVNRAYAVGTDHTDKKMLPPYTRSTALEAGWQWQIPLQHRVGNGYVFSSDFTTEQKALDRFLARLPHSPESSPRLLRFTTGRRQAFWKKNCIALGLASGFLEPLESTSISLIQTGISRLLQFYPLANLSDACINEANREFEIEFTRTRDFIILHYALSQRQDTEFWRHFNDLELPDTLRHKIEVFQESGHLINYEGESFGEDSWLTMYYAFSHAPRHVDLKSSRLALDDIQEQLKNIKQIIQAGASHAGLHSQFISKHCDYLRDTN